MYGNVLTMNKRIALWKTCRVVANETRLTLLWHLFERGELCVNQLQSLAGMTQPNASNQLRLLNAQGLILYRRKKMNVIYRAEAVGDATDAVALLHALRRCYEESVPFSAVIRAATAFTHERRIEIVCALNKGSLLYNELMDATGMGSSALSRHLRKLETRGLVRCIGGQYRLRRPESILGAALLKIAQSC
jgi:DNA-binding transcriptional ArsR family regulator